MKNNTAMKRTIISMAMALLVLAAKAQDNSRHHVLSPTIEVMGGPRFAVISKEYRDEIKPRFMYQAGVLFGVEMRQKHGATFLKTGLLLDDYRFTKQESQWANLSFLDFPVNIGYLYRFNNKFSLSGAAGVDFVYCYHYKDNFGLDVNGKEVIKNMIFGTSVNVSAEYFFSKHISVFADVSANFFFNRTLLVKYTHEYEYPFPSDNTRAVDIPSFINAGVGIKYRLRE